MSKDSEKIILELKDKIIHQQGIITILYPLTIFFPFLPIRQYYSQNTFLKISFKSSGFG